MKTVLVPIANGSEEIEAVCVVDTLRRAGAEVTVASVEDSCTVTMSRKIKIVADRLLKDCEKETFDLIVLPGGMPGAERLRDNPTLKTLIQNQNKSGKHFAAICAAPAVALVPFGVLESRKSTCYPSPKFQKQLPDQSSLASRVVVSKNCITSQGPGTALEFSLQLVTELYGKEKAAALRKGMLIS
eukprot:TRINITY_DN4149_c0_g2_i1.p1 TRINITY_DN4149_c0_g2~~TRINITY_DN4149_c0_g2_i1.p1  ORF type:complete len:186 (-),score=20.16 TRINITY_DN4149_c0_g2_i1:10-567(-)